MRSRARPRSRRSSREISGANPARFDADMKAAVTELGKRVGREPLAAIGFCFGGGMIWRLLAARERAAVGGGSVLRPVSRRAATSPATGPTCSASTAGSTTRVNAHARAGAAALEAARLDYEILTFTEADHAFFNDTNAARFNAPAAEEAWRRVIGWFDDADDRRRGRHD